MRRHLLISIVGILVIAAALAGLLGALDSLANPLGIKTSTQSGGGLIGLGNGSSPALGNGSSPTTGENKPEGIAIKGPTHPPQTPLFEVFGAHGVSCLRTTVGETYTGSIWLPLPTDNSSQVIPNYGDIDIPYIRSSTKYSDAFVEISPIMPLGKGPIPISLYTTKPQGAQNFFFHQSYYTLDCPDDLKNGYCFQALTPIYSPDEIRNTHAVVVKNELLQLPNTLPQRVRDLAINITQGKTNDYDKLEAIITYLSQYKYDLDNAATPPGKDAVDFFLFEDKRGVCATFNSAFVVLARAVGIPARVVGGCLISPTDPGQIVRANQAHLWAEVPFEGLGWVTFDATTGGNISTTNNPIQISTITEISSMDSVVHIGKTFNVVGTVKSVSGLPIDGVRLNLFINSSKAHTSGILVGSGTVTQGTFNIMAKIPDSIDLGDYQLLAHCLGNAEYKDSWSDPQIKVVTNTSISLNVPQRAKESEPVTLQGQLNDETSKPISNQKIDILVDGKLVNQLITDADGHFQWTQIFSRVGNSTVEASYLGTDLQLASDQKNTLQILIPTTLTLQVQEKAEIKDSVLINGTLLQGNIGIPVSNQQIEILVNGQSIGDKLITNQDGVFTTEHTFNKQGNYQIEANFAGDSSYWESNAKAELAIAALSSQKIPIWLFPVIGVAVAAMMVGGFVLVRQLKRRGSITRPSDIRHISQPRKPSLIIEDHGISLKIGLPQIKNQFPDVWGIGDELEIACYLLDQDGNPLDASSLEIIIGQETHNVTTDKSGTAKIQYTFKKKGEYILAATFKGVPGSGNIHTDRPLRIVDYREEIVSLFKTLTDWLRNIGIEFTSEATPREIQRAVQQSGSDTPVSPLEDSVSCFEEADFSLHPISRNAYEKMYLAQQKIKENERKSTNDQAIPISASN
jgi:transglutaminase-like putative cysteine protease